MNEEEMEKYFNNLSKEQLEKIENKIAEGEKDYYIEKEITIFEPTKSRKVTKEYNDWRYEVLARDDYTCQMCGHKEDLHVHHIKRYVDNEELRIDVNNGITLCNNCHYKVTGKENEYEDMFIEMIINKILNRFDKN